MYSTEGHDAQAKTSLELANKDFASFAVKSGCLFYS